MARVQPRTQKVALTTIRIVLAVAFALAGSLKIIGIPMMVAVFEHIGFGQWFRYVTGAIEIVFGALLLVPRLAGAAAVILAATMACAIISHLTVVPGPPAPAAILMALCLVVAWFYREQTASLLGVEQRRMSA